MMLVKKRNDATRPSIFDDLFMPYGFGQIAGLKKAGTDVPAVNVKETDEEFHVELIAPGKNKEDFAIELNDDTLSISSEVKEEHKAADKEEKYTRREFYYSSFKREFTLPETVDTEGINASYEAGVLRVILPKKTPVEHSKRLIDVL